MKRYILLKTKQELKSKLSINIIFNSRILFFLVMLLIFYNLWSNITPTKGITSGIHLVWYFMIIESILVAQPGLGFLFDHNFISGNFIYNTIRPVSFKSIVLINDISASIANYLLNLIIGTLFCIILTKQFPFLESKYIIILILGAVGVILDTALRVLIKLCSFWIKRPFPLILAYQKMSFVFGGIFFPLHYYPDWLKKIGDFLPFKIIFYYPASSFYTGVLPNIFFYLIQIFIWYFFIFISINLLYKLGLKKIAIAGVK